MDSREVIIIQSRAIKTNELFQRWLSERKEFIIPLLFLFVVVDPLFTFIGTQGYGFPEGNSVVSTMMEVDGGWFIWLFWKALFGIIGTIFMFVTYYMINTTGLSSKEKERALMVEYGAWSFIISFLFLIILHWATRIILV